MRRRRRRTWGNKMTYGLVGYYVTYLKKYILVKLVR